MRGFDRSVDVFGVRHSHVGQYLLVGRVVGGLVAACRFVPGATVVQVKMFRHNLHGVSRRFFCNFVVSHLSLLSVLCQFTAAAAPPDAGRVAEPLRSAS